MKGAIFIAFNEMIESAFGLEMWEKLLSATQAKSGGIYTSVEDYPDEELFSFVQELSRLTETPAEALVAAFGKSLFNSLNQKYPKFVAQEPTFFGFLESIDGTIHKEVEKLYNNPSLPAIECETLNENELLMHYRSPRKLCILAEGLIAGAAAHYDVECTIKHDVCLHKGDKECQLHLRIK